MKCCSTVLFPSLFLLLASCGSGGDAPPPKSPVPPPASTEPARPADAVWRRDVKDTVNGGLGKLLGELGIVVEPKLEAGQFVGFRIVQLELPKSWGDVDLASGDVILRVNAMPIERDTEAFAAFESLKTANSLTIQYWRAGEERQLRYRILDRPGQAPAAAAPSGAAQKDPPKAVAAGATGAADVPPPTRPGAKAKGDGAQAERASQSDASSSSPKD